MLSREEAESQGFPIKETSSSMKRRCFCHDYSQPDTYLITLVVNGRKPLLGTLIDGDNDPYVSLSPLGNEIASTEVHKIEYHYPMVTVWKTCIMPDHIHMIINVKETLPGGKNLGNVLRAFKAGCTRAWWNMEDSTCAKAQGTLLNNTCSTCNNKATDNRVTAAFDAVPNAVPNAGDSNKKRPSLFEQGYNDRIISRMGQLDNWKRYLDDNPRRLAIKRRYPQYFTVLHDIEVAGQECQAIGNRFLLDIPLKAAVIIHHHYSSADCARLRAEWLAVGEAGGVLVGTAVGPMEKTIMREAMESGYNIILLRNNGFPPMYKPSGESFDRCSRGQLLQISPYPHNNKLQKITRQQCLGLNELAEAIVAG